MTTKRETRYSDTPTETSKSNFPSITKEENGVTVSDGVTDGSPETKTKEPKFTDVEENREDGKPSPNDLKEKADYNGQVRKDAQHPSDKKGGVKDKEESQKKTF